MLYDGIGEHLTHLRRSCFRDGNNSGYVIVMNRDELLELSSTSGRMK